jgi:hypothetical protein
VSGTDLLTLVPGLYLAPTGAGALHAVTSAEDRPVERLLRLLLRAPDPVSTDRAADLWTHTGLHDPAALAAVVAEAQDAGWLEGRTRPPAVPTGPLGVELPALLSPLSEDGDAALVDDQGFTLSSVGFGPEAVDELSILAAEVVRLQQRRTTSAAATTPVTGWGLIDHRGAPSVALYPIAIGGQSFVLIVGGLPRLAQEAFVALVTALSRRYGAPADGPHLTRTSPPPH